jgi:hypothetical protein
MKYRNRETAEILTGTQIKRLNSNVSFAPNTFSDLGWDEVKSATKPEPTTELKVVYGNGVTQDSGGNWVEAWAEADKFSGEDKVAQETAYTAKLAAEASEKTQAASKVEGIEILGVMCSATKKDQTGMLAVGFNKLLADMAGQAFPSTKFEFENGTELVITADNYAAIQALWVPFRQSFFTVS